MANGSPAQTTPALRPLFIAPTLEARESWWISVPRDQWSAVVAKEMERMPWTRYGKTIQLGLDGPTRERGPRAVNMRWEDL